MDNFKVAITSFLLDPKNHDVLAILKGLRNGLVYGAKIRFPHALVMALLFRTGTLKEKLISVLRATKQHAINLGTFVTIYKTALYLFTHHPNLLPIPFLPPSGSSLSSTSSKPTTSTSSPHPLHTFLAGVIGGYYVFGRENNPINQQIVLYVFARVVLALAKLAIRPTGGGGPTTTSPPVSPQITSTTNRGSTSSFLPQTLLGHDIKTVAWPVFASMSWGAVMCLFNGVPDTVQPSLRSSMQYLYLDSEKWSGIRDFFVYNE
ncbi:Tim17/Tim22/Tim23/Pmp24 family-domain-containing protein [Peziza echinospora]|nr:Tim17/Tim22/Tim23/Pmp24 family-domain-containing protein [Peziza echinospora]